MKRISNKIFVTCLLVTTFISAFAQVHDTLNTNNISAIINSNGVLFTNPTNNDAGFEVPAGGGVHSIYAAGAWFGGKPVAHQDTVLFSGSMFSNQSDWNNGPLDNNGALIVNPNDYTRIWHAKRSDIDQLFAYRQAFEDGTVATDFPNGYSIPEWITSWPAHAVNDPLSNVAPFADTDGDGIYNPLSTDYPLFYGDECLYMILNDITSNPTCSGGLEMGIEVHVMVYSFNSTDPVLNNAVFARYTCINRGALDFNDFYVGLWADIDLGTSFDDFIGCNVEQGYFFGYNGDDFDEQTFGSPGYGTDIPVQVVSFIQGPKMDADGLDNTLPSEYAGYDTYGKYGIGHNDGIVDNEHWGMSSFKYYNIGSHPVVGNPITDANFYNYMSGKWLNGTPVTYGGSGTSSGPGSTTIPCEYMFPGDSDPLHQGTNGVVLDPWDEVSSSNVSGDRRGIGAIGPFSYSSQDTLSFDVVFLNVNNLSNAADTWDRVDSSLTALRSFYVQSPMFEIANLVGPFTSVENRPTPAAPNIHIYPNPSAAVINLNIPIKETSTVSIFNQNGQLVLSTIVSEASSQIDIRSLSSGLYELVIQSRSGTHKTSFMKISE